MNSQILISKSSSSRSIAIQPSSKQGVECFTLLLSQSDSSSSQQRISASFTRDFDAFDYVPLLNTPIYGCLGLVQNEGEPFICVVTDCSLVGILEDQSIYRINNVMFFSLISDQYDEISDDGKSYVVSREIIAYESNLDSTEVNERFKHPCRDVQRFLSSGSFYFSYNFDLTRSAKNRFQQFSKSFSLWETADNRY
jgi:hypothetical protein